MGAAVSRLKRESNQMSGERANQPSLEQAVGFIEPWLEYRFERLQMPGLAVAISHAGKLAYQGTFGLANTEDQIDLTPNHLFQIGSQSKTFTATAVMQIAQSGEVDIDDAVTRHLPDLSSCEDERWAAVTVRQLLSHTSGISRDGQNADFWEQSRAFPDRQELLDEVRGEQLVFDPGSRMKYSNLGYGLLGLLIERVSGTPYADFVSQNIIEPLDLRHTLPNLSQQIDQLITTGYGQLWPGKKRAVLPSSSALALDPATGMYSTTTDLCTYYSSHIPNNGDTRILGEEAKREMQQTEALVPNSPNVEYGLGINIGHVGTTRITGHGGGVPGHISNTVTDNESGVVVTAYTNSVDGDALGITLGITEVLNHYNQYVGSRARDYSKFNCRAEGLWSTRQILAVGERIVSIDPNNWHPFSDTETLEYVDDQTLKIVQANGFRSEGELVYFTFDDDSVRDIRYCGRTMTPTDK